MKEGKGKHPKIDQTSSSFLVCRSARAFLEGAFSGMFCSDPDDVLHPPCCGPTSSPPDGTQPFQRLGFAGFACGAGLLSYWGWWQGLKRVEEESKLAAYHSKGVASTAQHELIWEGLLSGVEDGVASDMVGS